VRLALTHSVFLLSPPSERSDDGDNDIMCSFDVCASVCVCVCVCVQRTGES